MSRVSDAVARLDRALSAGRAVEWPLVGALVLASLLYRLWLSAGGTFGIDMAYWVRWGHALAAGGPAHFYARTNSDYAPGYPYVLWLLTNVQEPLRQAAHQLGGWQVSRDSIFKLPAILADEAIAVLLYLAGRRWFTPSAGLLAAALYAVSPVPILMSARYGQVESIPTCLLLLASMLLIEQRLSWCGMTLALSVLTKPTGAVLLPVVAILCWRRQDWRGLGCFCLVFAVTIAVLFAPFAPGLAAVPGYVLDRFEVLASRWPITNYRSYNLWMALDYQSRAAWRVGPSDLGTWLGLSLHAWGWLLLLGAAALALPLLAARPLQPGKGTARLVLPVASVLALAFFLLLTRMHERHLFPAVGCLALTCVVLPRFYPLYLWYSVAFVLNLNAVHGEPMYFSVPRFLTGQYQPLTISLLNLACLGAAIVLTYVTVLRPEGAAARVEARVKRARTMRFSELTERREGTGPAA